MAVLNCSDVYRSCVICGMSCSEKYSHCETCSRADLWEHELGGKLFEVEHTKSVESWFLSFILGDADRALPSESDGSKNNGDARDSGNSEHSQKNACGCVAVECVTGLNGRKLGKMHVNAQTTMADLKA